MWPEWIFSCSEMSILIHLLLIVYAQICTILLGPEFEIQNGLHINGELPSSCVCKCMRKHPRQFKPIWARLTWEWLQCVSIPCTLLNWLEGSTTDSSVLQTSQKLAQRGESLPQLHLLTHFSLIFSPSKTLPVLDVPINFLISYVCLISHPLSDYILKQCSCRLLFLYVCKFSLVLIRIFWKLLMMSYFDIFILIC